MLDSSQREGLGERGEQQALCEQGMHPCNKGSQQLSGQHQDEHCQWIKRGDPSSLFSIDEITAGDQCSTLGSLMQETY